MTVSADVLLLIYCLAIAGVSLLGGWLPARVRMTHTRTQVVMSFVAGLMLGVAFYHLLPHSLVVLDAPHAADVAVWWLMIGLVVMLLLLRMFHFHQHDFTAPPLTHRAENEEAQRGHVSVADSCHHHHDHHSHVHVQIQPGDEVAGDAPGHPAAAAPGMQVHRLSWLGLALGLGLHTVIDGIALGAALQGDAGHAAGLVGLGVFLAILLHKPLDAMSITTLMAAGGWGVRARRLANLGFALLCPLGALLFFVGVDMLGEARHHVVAAALAFSAGAFICIALSDLLPEVHFHSHDRIKLTIAFLLGIALAWSLVGLEPAGAHLAHG